MRSRCQKAIEIESIRHVWAVSTYSVLCAHVESIPILIISCYTIAYQIHPITGFSICAGKT